MFDSKEIAKKALIRVEEIKEKKKRGRRRLEVTIAVAGVCTAAAAIYAVAPTIGPLNPNIVIEDGALPLGSFPLSDNDAIPYKDAARAAEPPGITIAGYDSVTVRAGETCAEMILLNPESNACRFSFEIVLADAEETLYKSGLVAPGMCVENIKLSRPLEKGEYKACLIIRAYEAENFDMVSDARVEFDLIAE